MDFPSYSRSKSTSNLNPGARPPSPWSLRALGLEPLERMSSGDDAFQTPQKIIPQYDHITPHPNLRSSPTTTDLEAELERLQKENFNLKLKIYYLEERLSKVFNGNLEEAVKQTIEQKVLLSEKNKELEERNLLLVKARGAIESLQTDLEFMRAQQHQQGSSPRRIESLNQQIALLRSELEAQKNVTEKREGEISKLQTAGLERANTLDILRQEKNALEQEKVSMAESAEKARQELQEHLETVPHVKELQDLIKSKDELVGTLRDTVKELKERTADLEKDKEEMSHSIEAKENLVRESMETLDAIERRDKETKDHTNHLEREIENLKDVIRKMDIEKTKMVSDHSAESQKLESEAHSLKSANKEYEVKLDETASKLFTLQEENAALDGSLKETAKRVEELEEEKKSMLKQLETVKSEIASVEGDCQKKVDDQMKSHQRALEELRNYRVDNFQDKDLEIQKMKQEVELLLARVESRNGVIETMIKTLASMFGQQSSEAYNMDENPYRPLDLADPSDGNLEWMKGELMAKIKQFVNVRTNFESTVKSLEEKFTSRFQQIQMKFNERSVALDTVTSSMKRMAIQAAMVTRNTVTSTTHEAYQIRQLEARLRESEDAIKQLTSALKASEDARSRLEGSCRSKDDLSFSQAIDNLKSSAQREASGAALRKEKERWEEEALRLREKLSAIQGQLEVEGRRNKELNDILASRLQSDNSGKLLGEAQSRIQRLAENNRVLILQLEEKQAMGERISRQYQKLKSEHTETLQEVKTLKLKLSQQAAQMRDVAQQIDACREKKDAIEHLILDTVDETRQYVKEKNNQMNIQNEKQRLENLLFPDREAKVNSSVANRIEHYKKVLSDLDVAKAGHVKKVVSEAEEAVRNERKKLAHQQQQGAANRVVNSTNWEDDPITVTENDNHVSAALFLSDEIDREFNELLTRTSPNNSVLSSPTLHSMQATPLFKPFTGGSPLPNRSHAPSYRGSSSPKMGSSTDLRREDSFAKTLAAESERLYRLQAETLSNLERIGVDINDTERRLHQKLRGNSTASEMATGTSVYDNRSMSLGEVQLAKTMEGL